MSDTPTIEQLLSAPDFLAATDEITRLPDTAAAMKLFFGCMRELYWKRKDLPRALLFAFAGIIFGQLKANQIETANPDLAKDLRHDVKGLCYDIASFSWNGWDEPGIPISRSDLAIGLEAAKANLRLADELKRGDLPMSRAYWMLAGHQLSAGDRAAAAKSYEAGERHAAAAKSKSDELLNQAFAHMVDVLNSPNEAGARQRLDQIKKQLAAEKDGEEFVRQVETALKVFSR